MTATRVSLVALGSSTRVLSTLCGECPFHVAGCCHAPPAYDLADVARVVQAAGGLDFLLHAIASGTIVAEDGVHPRALKLATHKRRIVQGTVPKGRALACSQLSDAGCTLDPSYRPATCNYYVCAEGLRDEHAPEDPARPYAVLREWWTRINGAFDAAFPSLPENWSTDRGLLLALAAFLDDYERRAGLARTDAQNSV